MGPLKDCSLYSADGFSEDCNTLIRNCLEGGRKVTYPIFCEVWREMNFGCLYQGRNLVADIAELSEEVLYVAKDFMLQNTEIFEELVAAVFLMYGLVKLQPYPGFAALRLCPEDVEGIRQIETTARKERRLDVLYVLGSLLTEAHFHADSRERGMEWTLRKYFDGITRFQQTKPSGVLRHQNKIHQVIKELSNFSEEYVQLKMKLQDSTSRSLNYWDSAFPQKLSSSLKILSSNPGTSQVDSRSECFKLLTSRSNEEPITRSLDAIRQKAMKSVVSPVKHLIPVHERNKKGRRKISYSTSDDVMVTAKKVKNSNGTKRASKARKNIIGIADREDEKKEKLVKETKTNDTQVEVSSK